MSAPFTGRDVIALILDDPAEYERLLHSYMLLLGRRGLWWERVAEAEREGWKRAVRRSIAKAAERSGLEPRTLAEWLDHGDMPQTRRVVLDMARERVKGRG